MAVPTSSRSRALIRLLRAELWRWLALGVLLAIRAALALGGPLVVRRIVDRARAGTTTGEIVHLASIYLAVAIVAQVIGVVVAWYATTNAWRATNHIRMQMTRHVLLLDHEFHRRHTAGELIQRVDGDVTNVSDFLGRVVPRAVGAIFLVFGMIIALATVDWRLALGTAVYVGLCGFVVAGSRHRAVRESSDEMGTYARLYGGIEERLTAAEDLRANGAGPHAMWRFVEDSAAVLRAGFRREGAFLKLWWLVQLLVALGSIISLLASAALISAGTITIGTGFLLFQYTQLLYRPLEDMIHHLETVQKANGAMSRVVELMAVTATIVDEGRTSPPSGPLAVNFENVSFDYGDDELVLGGVDLQIGPGRSVGIIGRSGSGKTTLSRIVLRLVEATHGSVLLGGVPIADIPLQELRRRIALIPQEVELFSGTIRDNVSLFDSTIPAADVEAALLQVGLARLVDAGIDRELGAGGTGLSAGEAQLLALARVWLRQPDLMVLDEATARVDPQTERLLEDAVHRLMRGRTTLIIAHRLSTLRDVDDIVVVDGGRIVEAGMRATLEADPTSRLHRLLTLATGRPADTDLDDLDGLELHA